MRWDSLDALGWAKLVLWAVLSPCYVAVLVQHWRRPGTSRLLGGGRAAATAWAVGFLVSVSGTALPVTAAAEDVLSVSGLALMVSAVVVSWRRPGDDAKPGTVGAPAGSRPADPDREPREDPRGEGAR